MSTAEYYRAQPDVALRETAATTLAQVRERCERSAMVWTDMAERLERTDAMKLLRNGN